VFHRSDLISSYLSTGGRFIHADSGGCQGPVRLTSYRRCCPHNNSLSQLRYISITQPVGKAHAIRYCLIRSDDCTFTWWLISWTWPSLASTYLRWGGRFIHADIGENSVSWVKEYVARRQLLTIQQNKIPKQNPRLNERQRKVCICDS